MENQLTPLRHQIADFLIDHIISDMTRFLMDDYGYSMEQAMEVIYTSKMVESLTDEDTELYVQSPSYNYELLIKEKGLYPSFDKGMSEMVAE